MLERRVRIGRRAAIGALFGAVVSPAIARRRYIDVGSYCALDDRQDASGGVAAALRDGSDREIVFTSGMAARRTYRLTGRKTFQLPQRCTVIWDDGTVVDFSAYGHDPATRPVALFSGRGTIQGSSISCIGDNAKGSHSLRLANPNAHLEKGQRWIIQTTQRLHTLEGSFTLVDGAANRAENILVKSVDGATLHLVAPLQDDYPANTFPVIRLIEAPARITLRNPNVIGPGRHPDVRRRGDTAFLISYGSDCVVEGGRIDLVEGAAVKWSGVLDGKIVGLRGKQDQIGKNNEPGTFLFISDASENILVKDCAVTGGWQSFCLTNTQLVGISRNIKFDGCSVKGADGAFSTHNRHERWSVVNCLTEDVGTAIDNRISTAYFERNTFRRTKRNVILTRISPTDMVVSHNRVEHAFRFVRLDQDPDPPFDRPPRSWRISDNHVTDSHRSALSVEYKGQAGIKTLDGLTIERNVISSNGKEPSIMVSGKWKNLVISENNLTGSGRGVRAIVVQGSADRNDNSPITPVIRGNRYKGLLPPVVIGGTGKMDMTPDVELAPPKSK